MSVLIEAEFETINKVKTAKDNRSDPNYNIEDNQGRGE